MKKLGGFIKKHKKLVIVLAVVLVLVIVIAVLVHRTKKKAEELLSQMTQETYVLEKRNLTESVSGTGKISSVQKQDIAVASMANTKVTALNVKLGDEVKEGDIICTFDTEELERNLAEAREDLAITQKKTANSMDNQSRGLYETQLSAVNSTNRNLEALDKAQREYDTAAGEKAEASRVFDEVYDVYEDYYDEDEYYDLKEELAEVNKKLEEYDAKTTSTTADAGEFEAAKEALVVYINNNGQTAATPLEVSSDLNALRPGDTNTEITPANMVTHYDALTDSESSIKNDIETKVAKLQSANADYISAVNATAANLEEYNSLRSRASALSSRISNMETAKSNMNSAKSGVDSAQSKLNSAGDTLENAKRTQEDKFRSDVNGVKDAENNYDSAKLDSSVVGRSYEDNIRKYEKQLEEATIRAPFSGVITALNISEGAVYPGQTAVTVEDMSTFTIETSIDEYDISRIAVGQKVVFKTNATGNEELEAVVTEVAPRATVAVNSTGQSTSSTASYQVKMDVKTPDDRLRLDMTAKLNIIVDEAADVYAVPYSAIRTDEDGSSYIEIEDDTAAGELTGDMTDEEAAVAALDAAAGNKPSKRIPVTVGVETDYYVEVISDELYDGMVVIVSDGGIGSMEDMMSAMGPMGGM